MSRKNKRHFYSGPSVISPEVHSHNQYPRSGPPLPSGNHKSFYVNPSTADIIMDEAIKHPGYTHIALQVADIIHAVHSVTEFGITITEEPNRKAATTDTPCYAKALRSYRNIIYEDSNMNLIEALSWRYAVREFSAKAIDEHKIEDLQIQRAWVQRLMDCSPTE